MAIQYALTKWGSAFPSKVKAGTAGHIINVTITQDLANGSLCKVGTWNSFDNYNQGAAPGSDFAGKIVEKAANGNYYVQVTKVNINDPVVFLYNAPVVAEDYNKKFTDEKNFYNKQGDVVKGYELTSVLDIIELSPERFSNTPVVGKAVSYADGKYVVAS